MRSTVTIIGLTEFTDEAIWEDLIVPEGIERDLVIDTILFECGELELLYSEPRLLSRLIKNWATAEQLIWQKLYNTLHFDYNPIWNKDGKIVESEHENRISKNLDSAAEHSKAEGYAGRSHDETGKVSAYNSGTFENRDRTETQETALSDSDIERDTASDREGYDANEREYSRKEQGNIGVTTTQQMIREEREVVQFDIYDYIAQSFKKRFCICVY